LKQPGENWNACTSLIMSLSTGRTILDEAVDAILAIVKAEHLRVNPRSIDL
jgi:hypothetical protein